MTREEKQLLFKDLCARLPYGVVIHTDTDWKDVKLDNDHRGIGMLYYEHYGEEAKKECGYDENDCSIIISGCYYGDIKPYLRPMSSMTKEELKELNDKYGSIAYFFIQEPPYYYGLQAQHSDIGSIEISEFSEIYDWLNAHHFDYRGLIPMGLALEALEEMYKND